MGYLYPCLPDVLFLISDQGQNNSDLTLTGGVFVLQSSNPTDGKLKNNRMEKYRYICETNLGRQCDLSLYPVYLEIIKIQLGFFIGRKRYLKT